MEAVPPLTRAMLYGLLYWSLTIAVAAALPLLIGQEVVENDLAVHLRHDEGGSAVVLHSFGFAGQAVALRRGPRLHLAGARDAETLFRARVGFHFWHFLFLSVQGQSRQPNLSKPDRPVE